MSLSRVNLARWALLGLLLACGPAPLLHGLAHVHVASTCSMAVPANGTALHALPERQSTDHCPLCTVADHVPARITQEPTCLGPAACQEVRFDSPTNVHSTTEWGSPPARAPPVGL
jgi:hypothetical protein